MTIPWLMNCSHSDEGWCLECVQRQQYELTLWGARAVAAYDGLDDHNRQQCVKLVNEHIDMAMKLYDSRADTPRHSGEEK